MWHHHHGYHPKHWLDLTALCRLCHSGVHAGRIPEPRLGQVRTSVPGGREIGTSGPRAYVAALLSREVPAGTRYPERYAWAQQWLDAHPGRPGPGAPRQAWQRFLDLVPPNWSEVSP